jgi:oxygen-independent coproporphyrinogen-3 oxidase
LKEPLLDALCRELVQRSAEWKGVAMETLYFGGGTPSLLTADELQRIFEVLFRHYDLNGLKECTLEANPDDITTAYLRALRPTPVNRFSMGVQSFRDEDLQYMHRAHNAQQADYAIKAAQDAGFPDISIDLIYGTPGLTDAAWRANLQKVRVLQLPHLSAYALTVEEGTRLHHNITRKQAAPVDPEQSAGQFEILMEEAEKMGLEHYEISNLSLPGRYALHNTNYWRGVPYLGAGPSAHSFDGHSRRRWNVANNAQYIKGVTETGMPPFEEEVLTPEQHLNEYLMTGLRTQWGVDLSRVEREGGTTALQQIRNAAAVHQERGLLVEKDGKLLLTRHGKLFADAIAGDLFL